MHFGMKVRVAMTTLIYRKSLRLSKKAMGETTVGHMVNLLTNDVGRFDLAFVFLHYFCVGPLQAICVTYLMYLQVRILQLKRFFSFEF